MRATASSFWCNADLQVVAVASNGDVFAQICVRNSPQHGLFRMPNGTTTIERVADLPFEPGDASCPVRVQVLDDDLYMMANAVDNVSAVPPAIWRIDLTDPTSGFERLFEAQAELRYWFVSAAEAYAVAPGGVYSGASHGVY